MKVYADREIPQVEILLSNKELKMLVDALVEFESSINQYQSENTHNGNMGFTHLHFKDINKTCANNNSDIVFYVDLNE